MSVTRIIMRNGQSVPTSGDLEVAELAVNTLDGSVYVKDENNQVVPVGTDYDDSQIIADLEFEVDERKAADTRIEGDLQTLDVSINAGLTAEVLARTNADSDLQDQLDELEGKVLDGNGNPIGGGDAVESVNGETGEVVLDAADVGAMAIGDAYTKADSDAKYELKGAGGGGASIDSGTSVGQMLRWDGSDWKHTSKVMLDTHGMMTIDSGKIVGDECGLHFDAVSEAILPIGGDGRKSTLVDFGDASNKFRAAYFSGRVDCGSLYVNGQQITSGGGGGNDARISDTQIGNWDDAYSWGDHASAGYVSSLTLNNYATTSWVSSNYQPKGNYLTSSSLTSYATQSWVSQNYQAKGNYELAGTAYTKSQSDAKYELKGAGAGFDGSYSSSSPAKFTMTAGDGSSFWVYAPSNARGAEIHLQSGSNNQYFRCGTSGNFEIVNSGYTAVTFQCTNAGNVIASGDVTAFSDSRLKEDVKTLDGSKVYEMRGVSFTKDGREGSGVIAQELREVAPELVNEDGEYLSVAYGNLVGYLIEAVKELKAEVEELKRG